MTYEKVKVIVDERLSKINDLSDLNNIIDFNGKKLEMRYEKPLIIVTRGKECFFGYVYKKDGKFISCRWKKEAYTRF